MDLQYVQLTVVLDANVVLRAISYSISKDKAQVLEIALQNELATFVAPMCLEDEVKKYIPEFASDLGKSPELLQKKWDEKYKPFIKFYNTDSSNHTFLETQTNDYKDIPYTQVYRDSDADLILSNDKHLKRLGITQQKETVNFVLNLTEYATVNEKFIQFYISGYLVGNFTIALVKMLIDLFKKYPLLLFVGLFAAVIIYHNTSRDNKWISELQAFVFNIVPISLIEKICIHIHELPLQKNNLMARVPNKKFRRGLHFYISVILTKSNKPLSVKEIKKKVKESGYMAKCVNSANSGSYVKKVLRSDNRFNQTEDDFWLISK